MIFREIAFESDDYREECELRQAVLRAPLGLDLFREDLSQERSQWHFGLFDENNRLAACVIAVMLSPTQAKIRQMAVLDTHQGMGLGRMIIDQLEHHLSQRGFVHLSLHARMTAIGFYAKLGYAQSGREFTEVGIPHVKMEKVLAGHGS